ncbi:MAG: flagellar filament protein FlaA [Spirochaetes bacterium]|nr:MAG: flagellar filament protein FlaA [Spirochaetota bacterium]
MQLLKKAIIYLLLIFCSAVYLVAQERVEAAGEPQPEMIGIDTAQQALKEVSISKFEDPAFWYGVMARDEGLITLRRFEGGPLDKKPIPGEVEAGIEEQDKYVLGVKVQFFARGMRTFVIKPVKPLPVEGICKTVSVWVVGRNMNHMLKLLISDYFGKAAEITMGKLNFSGWKKLTVAIPPHIVQKDYHYSNKTGITIEGFKIETDPMESYGNYYIYFDALRVVTDLFSEETRDRDDLPDSW